MRTLSFVLAVGVLLVHLLFILWVIFGALFTRKRPLLRWLHIASLLYGVAIEIWAWTCPLTPLEDWFRIHAGLSPYEGGFLLHYLEVLIYPDVPPSWLTVCGIAVCLFNLAIYALRFRHARCDLRSLRR